MNCCKRCQNYHCVICSGCESQQLCKMCLNECTLCSCCSEKISTKYLCNFCILIIVSHPLCLQCKNRGCYFDSPCFLGNKRKLNQKILKRILQKKIKLVAKIANLYAKTRERLYLPGGYIYKQLEEEFYSLALINNNINQ